MDSNAILQKVNAVIRYVWENPHCAFYRNYWDEAGIHEMPKLQSLSDLTAIPLLSREALGKVSDPSDRLYIERTEVDALFSTSGTTGKKALFFWIKFPEQPKRIRPYLEFGGTTLMSFNSYHKFMMYASRVREAGMRALAGDAHNLPRSAQLARLGNVDALYIPATLALMFADHLRSAGALEQIRLLVLWGEYCSPVTLSLLKERYPNVRYIFEYTLAEIGGCLAQSNDTCSAAAHIKHVDNDAYYVEVEDGELIVTTLTSPGVFPFLRYRTGDGASLRDEQCTCGHRGQTILLHGRIGGDFVRIGGAEVRAEELERVLAVYAPYIEPTFQLEVGEMRRGEVRIATLDLRITKRDNVQIDDRMLRERIAFSMNREFKLSQNMNLDAAVAAKLFAPLSVSFQPKQASGMKHRRLLYAS